jgi:hypothetical protein
MCICYFELPKLPEVVDGSDELKLWLALFNAKTKEELQKLQTIGGAIMSQAVTAYHHVSASGEFKELERLRYLAKHNEASALANARRKGVAEGMQQGMQQMLDFLKSGRSLEEAEQEFAARCSKQ